MHSSSVCEARPAAEQALATATRLAFSPAFRDDLRAHAGDLFDPVDWMRRAPWFLHFGSDAAAMSEQQLEVLRHLDTVSLHEQVNIAALDELGNVSLERLRSGVLVAATQRRLMRRIVVRPGARPVTLHPGDCHVVPAAVSFGEARLRAAAGVAARPLAVLAPPVAPCVARRRGARGRRVDDRSPRARSRPA